MNSSKTPHIIDTTLREGEQTPGLLFTLAEKKNILAGLVSVGVPEAELGIASKLNPCTTQLLAHCRKELPELSLSTWCRCSKEDISHAAELRPDILSLSIPVSDIHLKDRLNKSRSWALKTMTESIAYATKMGMEVSIGFEDATRSEEHFLHQMALAAEDHGAGRIRLADTVGIASPGQFSRLVSRLRKKVSHCSLAVHTHNDFGMATANAIAALESGATSVDGVVLGLGERSGCARLEELVAYLSLARNIKSLKPESLKKLATYVAKIADREISTNRPVLGDDIFTCETGLHLQGLQEKPHTYEPYSPDRVRARRKFLFGAKTGKRAVQQHLAKLSPSPANGSEELSPATIKAIRDTAVKLGRPLKDRELLNLTN